MGLFKGQQTANLAEVVSLAIGRNKDGSPIEALPSAASNKSPDVSSIKKKNAETASGNTPSNMLTGPVGIDPNALLLGKSSVLGS
jgi:hypothetical protein